MRVKVEVTERSEAIVKFKMATAIALPFSPLSLTPFHRITYIYFRSDPIGPLSIELINIMDPFTNFEGGSQVRDFTQPYALSFADQIVRCRGRCHLYVLIRPFASPSPDFGTGL